MDASDMTNIAVSKQKWTGWPDDISDELSLAQIDIPKRHSLSVTSTTTTAASAQSSSSLNVSLTIYVIQLCTLTVMVINRMLVAITNN
jgi:hypothetical protein